MKKSMLASVVLAVTVTGSAWAHHNAAGAFDLNQQRFTKTGTLTEIDWRYPHISLSVDVTSDQGQVETWLFEGWSPSEMLNRGIGKSDCENSIGKTITVEASPARDGSLSGLIGKITLADGKAASLGGTSP